MKYKKDVLFLCELFYPEYVSSATLPFDTAVSLSEAGFDVGVICGYPKEFTLEKDVPKKERYKNINIKRLKYFQPDKKKFLGRLVNFFSFTISVILHFFELRNYKSIIVYSNPPILPLIAALANKFFNTKVIFVSYDIYPEIAHATNTLSHNSLISRFMRIINRITFKHVTKVVALSNEMKEYLLNNRSSLSDEQVEIIPNWYEDKGVITFTPNNSHLSTIKEKSEIVVSYFGNMGTAQDLATIIDAIRILKEDSGVQFVFAGNGNKLSSLKQTVRNEGLNNVNIFDYLHGEDFDEAISISDCYLVSLARGLNGLAVPSKTYTYMMDGKPILAILNENSDIGKDLIEGDAGYVMQPGESHKLVEAIEELRKDKNKQANMGKNSRRIFLDKYTKQICTQQYVDMVQKMLGD